MHIPSQKDIIVVIYVEEELYDRGNGVHLDYGIDDARDFDDSRRGL